MDDADRAQPRAQNYDRATFEADTGRPAEAGSCRRWRDRFWEVVMVDDDRVHVIELGR